MLKTVTSITKKYPSTLLVGVGALVVQFAYCCWWILTLIGLSKANSSYNANGTQKLSDGGSYALYVYSLFTFYWTSQVIANVVHITIAGVFATFYFKGVAGPNGEVNVPVENPTSASLKRALTTSLGPNCYGSLLIAIIQTLKALADQARNQNGNDNIACTIILCCISCILSIVQDLLEYFNKYAFAQVAIYGKDYCTAAKDTWELAKARGIDALINDNLIGSVLAMGGLFIGIITGASPLLYVAYSSDFTNPSAGTYILVGLAGFLIGIVEFSVLANVIDSGVVSLDLIDR